ncbi:MAG: hypothetical protein PF541_07990 [Prolixibacteraceae bacterium]|jgi:3-hydroxymyristoyl/3-hydroxydecanoyl-(acyl carrier protein) dehydratase|nr:hypothetical protein [Prolixibacteraceae bacterium]
MTIQFLNTKTIKDSEVENLFDYSILENISVTAPYFALTNLFIQQEYVYADFTTELIHIDEEGPISAAEVGRHMAILGSVVLANENPKKEKHHYLATDAIITRCTHKSSSKFALKSRAKMMSISRKNGVVYGEIFENDGSILYTIEVTYMILGKPIFERMFEQFKVETNFSKDFNPYTTDSDFFDLKTNIESCFASIGIVKPEHCPGHFKNYPALPVARMGTSMGKIGGIHFMHLNPNEKKKYFISRAELHAKQLIFTGEEVMFRTEIVDPNSSEGMIIRVVAYTHKCDLIAEAILHFHY